MTKYEEMKEAAATQLRNFNERRQRCWQHGLKLINGFRAYCDIPSAALKFLRWTGDKTTPAPYEEAEPGHAYTIPGAMQFSEEDGYWHFGVRLALTQMQWIVFGVGISDCDGRAMVKVGGGNPRQIDTSDQNQCNEFYDSIVAFVKDAYRDEKSAANRIGFALGQQDEQTAA